MGLVRARLRIYGRVQGVFFRSTMREVANRLGVSGWVRNVPDGSVEAVVEGERSMVEELINWARRGPPLARVERVEVTWEEFKGDWKGFSVLG